MRNYRNRIIGAIIGVSVINLLTGNPDPIDDIPPDYTGKKDLACTGTNYEISGKSGTPSKDIDWDSAKPLTPTTLTLEFDKGKVIGWAATVDPANRAEEPQRVSQLISMFERVCPSRKSSCVVIQQDNKDYELFRTKVFEITTAGDLEAKGSIGTLGKNLANFATYHITDGKSYADAMDCKIR